MLSSNKKKKQKKNIGLNLCISGTSHVSESPLFLSLTLTHTGTHLSYPASTLYFPHPPLSLPTCSQLSYLPQAYSHRACTAKIVWPLGEKSKSCQCADLPPTLTAYFIFFSRLGLLLGQKAFQAFVYMLAPFIIILSATASLYP